MLMFTCIFAVVFVFAVQGGSESDLVLDTCRFGNIYEKGISAAGIPCTIYAHNDKNYTSTNVPMGADLENMVFNKPSSGKLIGSSNACKLEAEILPLQGSSHVHYYQYQHQCQFNRPYPHQYQYQCSCQCDYHCKCLCQYEHQRLRRDDGSSPYTNQYQNQYQDPQATQYQTQYQTQYPSQNQYQYNYQYQYKAAGREVVRYEQQEQIPPQLSVDDPTLGSHSWSSTGVINCKEH